MRGKLTKELISSFCELTSIIFELNLNRCEGSQDMSGCFLYMNCGHDGRASPNFRTFDSACTAAAYACGSDYGCARDYIVRSMLIKL